MAMTAPQPVPVRLQGRIKDWAPVPEHRGARDLRLAKNFWYAPAVSRDLVALGLRALVSRLCSDCRRRK
jgi:hypothetical protein